MRQKGRGSWTLLYLGLGNTYCFLGLKRHFGLLNWSHLEGNPLKMETCQLRETPATTDYVGSGLGRLQGVNQCIGYVRNAKWSLTERLKSLNCPAKESPLKSTNPRKHAKQIMTQSMK